MDILLEELTSGLPSVEQSTRLVLRLIAAVLLGAAIGYEREKAGKPAGLKTHISVTVGTAVFVIACAGSGMTPDDGISRVIQGIATGIGFLGAGSILKLREQRDIQGLTTAAGIWMTAAVGVTVGLGKLGIAILSTVLLLLILALVTAWERHMVTPQRDDKHAEDADDSPQNN